MPSPMNRYLGKYERNPDPPERAPEDYIREQQESAPTPDDFAELAQAMPRGSRP